MLNDTLEFTKYCFTLEAIDNITLPAYKGSTFHGGFGHALMKISPIWYRYFLETGLGKKGDWPKPFVILPPLDELQNYSKGHQFQCDLTLFGEATQHHAIAQAAIEYLGLQMGLGYEQGKYKVAKVVEIHPSTSQEPDIHTQELSLRFPTRLRLKENNRLCRKAPSFELIISRLLGRIKTLQSAYMASDTNKYHQHDLIEQAKSITIKTNNLQWDDWDRFSGRQKQWMKFGGLQGDIIYTGNLAPFMEILSLGEWLHIGNKTSFGLGKYELKIPIHS